MNSNNPFFQQGQYFEGSEMGDGPLGVVIHTPRAWTDEEGNRLKGRLPPCNPRGIFRVCDFPTAPREWDRDRLGSDTEPAQMSYILPIPRDDGQGDWGLWIDLRQCLGHTHHVGAFISTGGIGALTAHPTPIESVCLQQIRHQCPLHKVPLVGSRECPECGYELPPQNYLSSEACGSRFWRDGYMVDAGGKKGKVVQWRFTKNQQENVAQAVLEQHGMQAVEALGFALYLSAEPKPQPTYDNTYRGGGMQSFGGDFGATLGGGMTKGGPVLTRGAMRSLSMGTTRGLESAAMPEDNYGIGGGAEVEQDVPRDNRPIEFWASKPALVIVVNWCPEEWFVKQLLPNRRKKKRGVTGALGIPTGNP